MGCCNCARGLKPTTSHRLLLPTHFKAFSFRALMKHCDFQSIEKRNMIGLKGL